MNPGRRRAITSERLEEWGRFMAREGATPVLMLGLVDGANRFTACTVEDVSTEQIVTLLRGVLDGLIAGDVEHSYGPGVKGGSS